MGFFKKTGKAFLVKAPLKVVSIPFSLVAPKGVRQNQKYFTQMVKARHAVTCPFCGQGRLMAVSELSDYEKDEVVIEEDIGDDVEDGKKTQGQLWQCNFCYQHIKTKTKKVSQVVSHIKNNGRMLYENGYAYQQRQDRLESGELRGLAAKRITYSRFFYVLSALTIIPFLYGAAQGELLYSFASLMFGIMIGFIGISNSYRAWQLYTDNVYSQDAKAQFHWWLRNRNWFLSPYSPDYDKGPRFNEGVYNDDEEEFYDGEPDTTENFDQGYEIPNFGLMIFFYVPPINAEPYSQEVDFDTRTKPDMY